MATAGDVSLPWAILVDGSGRPRLDAQGRPQIADPAGRVIAALETVSAGWLIPDAEDPVRRRILFGTRRAD